MRCQSLFARFQAAGGYFFFVHGFDFMRRIDDQLLGIDFALSLRTRNWRAVWFGRRFISRIDVQLAKQSRRSPASKTRDVLGLGITVVSRCRVRTLLSFSRKPAS